MNNKTKLGDVTIQIAAESNICCICLQQPVTCNTAILECCKHHIHKQCLFLLMLNGYKNCPLCRSEINTFGYFDKNDLSIRFWAMSKKEQDLYYHTYDELQYEMSKVNTKGFSAWLCGFTSRIGNNVLLWLLVILLYVLLILLIVIEHKSDERDNVPLEYYAIMNQ